MKKGEPFSMENIREFSSYLGGRVGTARGGGGGGGGWGGMVVGVVHQYAFGVVAHRKQRRADSGAHGGALSRTRLGRREKAIRFSGMPLAGGHVVGFLVDPATRECTGPGLSRPSPSPSPSPSRLSSFFLPACGPLPTLRMWREGWDRGWWWHHLYS